MADFLETSGLKNILETDVPLASEMFRQGRHVLIYGESGSGKTHITDRVLELAGVDPRSCPRVNCAAIPEGLVEAELFGHVRGAFTGATRDRAGLLGGDHGVIVLEEIGTLPKDLQARLLVFLDSGEYRPVGSSATKISKTQVIATTNEDPAAETFRHDLRWRFHLVTVPSILERRGDIIELFRHFAPDVPLYRPHVFFLMVFPWTGGVRDVREKALAAAYWHNKKSLISLKYKSPSCYSWMKITIPYLPVPLKYRWITSPSGWERRVFGQWLIEATGFLESLTPAERDHSDLPLVDFSIDDPDMRPIPTGDNLSRLWQSFARYFGLDFSTPDPIQELLEGQQKGAPLIQGDARDHGHDVINLADLSGMTEREATKVFRSRLIEYHESQGLRGAELARRLGRGKNAITRYRKAHTT